jgi:hypothetical protein
MTVLVVVTTSQRVAVELPIRKRDTRTGYQALAKSTILIAAHGERLGGYGNNR